tara:strand:+ start:3460 stop:4098 length:639 start_codon:yes stop_codon:yes gene_type:complete
MGQLNQTIQIKNVIDFYNIKNFVETGTGKAEVVQTVVEADDTLNIHTIEVIPEIFNKNKINFSYLKDVNWHLGTSFDILPQILPNLKGVALFWMDAHFPGADFGLSSYGDEKDDDKRLPLKKELETIVENRDTTNDVFVIDDLRIYEDGPFESGNWDERSKYGGDGIEFIEKLFDETHYIVRSYNAQGSIILFPVEKDIDTEVNNLVVGAVE